MLLLLMTLSADQNQFGLGSLTCIGRHISTLEMSKLIPEMLRSFDLEFGPERQWVTMNAWFVKPKQFSVRVTPRTGQDRD